MHTTPSAQEGLTFHHNGTPDGGQLLIVLDPAKIKTEFDNFNGTEFITITVEYNTVRDFVLQKLASRTIAKLEQMDGDQLAAYFSGETHDK